jgi:hypothetical protein
MGLLRKKRKSAVTTKWVLIPLLVLSTAFATNVLASDSNPALGLGSVSASTGQDLRHNVGALRDMEGKEVGGKYNEYLGYILAVDERGKLAEMQIPTSVAVTLPTDLLIDEGNRVRAPTISRGDILNMIRKQGGSPLLEVKNER